MGYSLWGCKSRTELSDTVEKSQPASTKDIRDTGSVSGL